MKFNVICISLAITIMAATSVHAAPILGSNGEGVAHINQDRIDVPAGKVAVDSEQIKVGGPSGATGVDKALSGATEAALGEKVVLRKRTGLVDNLVGGKTVTSAGEVGLVDKLTGAVLSKRSPLLGGALGSNLAGSGGANRGTVGSLTADLLDKRAPLTESLQGQQQKSGLVGNVVGTAGTVVDGVLLKRQPGFQEPGTYGSGMAANRPKEDASKFAL